MGKRLFLLYLLICSMPVQAQNSAEMEIQVVASPTHGLYYMIECLIDQPHRSPEMASTFRGRMGNWGPAQDALNEWEKQMNSDALSSLRLPAVQGRTPTLSDVLEKVALQAKNGEDLTARAAPWLGPEAAAALRNVLLVVEPLYEQYYWPGGAIKRKRETLLSDLKKADFQTSFSHACAFYRGQLPPGHQPTVALIPYVKGITEGKVRTRGHNSGDLQVIEVVVGQDDPGRAGVLFHEFVHALWAGQNPEEKNRWQERFEAHGLMGRLAYVQLNEGLATAIGNGWFDRKVQGQLNPKSWYSDPVIATYGRALYPVVREALEFGRPPTDAELDEMVDAFQRELPEAVSTFDVVAANFTTVSSREEAHQARYQKELMRLGQVKPRGRLGESSTQRRHFSGSVACQRREPKA